MNKREHIARALSDVKSGDDAFSRATEIAENGNGKHWDLVQVGLLTAQTAYASAQVHATLALSAESATGYER